jgi:hypothetical protein
MNDERYDSSPRIPRQEIGAFLRGRTARSTIKLKDMFSNRAMKVEISATPEARYTRAGSLRELGGTHDYIAGPIWRGNISVDKRTDITRGDVETFLDTELENLPYRTATLRQPVSCPDGRSPEGNGETGVKLFGGTPGCALAERVIEGDDFGNVKFTEDLAKMVKTLDTQGIAFGGHIDDHNHHDKCGCGAIDEMPATVALLGNEEMFPVIQNLTRAIMGEEYDEVTARRLLLKYETLAQHSDDYFERKGDNYPYRKQTIKILEQQAQREHHPVQKMLGKHNEVALIINRQRNTSFDRRVHNKKTDNKFQVFNFDYWACEDLAKIHFPQSPEKQRVWIHARIEQAVAAALLLTDGSLEVYVRE